MEKELEKINLKLDKLTDNVVDVKISQVKTEENLKEHMRRTALAEESIDFLRNDIKPLKRHVEIVNYLFKLTVAAGSILLFLNELGILKKILSIF